MMIQLTMIKENLEDDEAGMPFENNRQGSQDNGGEAK
jgi:hypothetical protein